MATDTRPQPIDYWRNHAYDLWLETQDVPIFKGYYVEDARNLERRHWDLRGCPATVISLEGHRGLEHVHVLEIPPGETIPPFKMALEEVVYVFEGQGLASVWAEGQPKISFEWQKHSLFRIPPNYHYQLSNARGDQPALTLHVSLLPLALGTNPSIDYFFNNPYVDLSQLYGEEGNFYSAAAQPVHLSGTGTFSSGARAEGLRRGRAGRPGDAVLAAEGQHAMVRQLLPRPLRLGQARGRRRSGPPLLPGRHLLPRVRVQHEPDGAPRPQVPGSAPPRGRRDHRRRPGGRRVRPDVAGGRRVHGVPLAGGSGVRAALPLVPHAHELRRRREPPAAHSGAATRRQSLRRPEPGDPVLPCRTRGSGRSSRRSWRSGG